ncbi:MAG: hypothetical protein IJ714_05955 [Bacteroidales bacterium]|nr:hypothetical protein [Bacteroidales bacterium]
MKRTVQSPKKIKQFFVALLAVLLVIGLFPAGANLLTKAVTKDGYTTSLPGEVTLGEYSGVGASLSAPADIAEGQWLTYGFGDKTYFYEAKFPIAAGETLTLTGDGSTLELDRGGREPNATRVNDLVDITENGGVHTLSLKAGETLNAGETYYYDLGGGEYYLFTPEQTLGGDGTATDRPRYLASSSYSSFYAGKPDRKGEQIAVVIDTNRHTLNYSGDQYTKHFIFQRASGLSDGQIYLIGRRGAVSGGSAPMSLIAMGSQHSTAKKDEGSKCSYTTPSYASRAMSGRELQNGSSLYSYNGSGFSGLPGNNYYIDAGTASSDDALMSAELFASSASTNNNVVSGLVSIGNLSGYRLTAVNAANDGYTDDRAFGSVYTWTKAVEQELIYHHYCETVDSVGLALINVNMSHNNGMVWAYSGNQLYNNNTMAGVNLTGGSRYLALSGGTWTAVDSSNTATTVYPYSLVVAYEKKAAALEQDLTVYSQNKGLNTLQATPMEKVSGELTYVGVKENLSFDITYRLTDSEGNPVSGTFGDVPFENGVGVKTGVRSGDTFNLGWVPEGYKLATTSVLPSDASDPDAKRYQKEISYEDATGTHDWAEGNGNAFAVGTAPTTLRYELDDPLRNVKLELTHNGTGSHQDDTFTLTPYITDETGAPFTGTFHDRLGRNFVFENGSPNATTQRYLTLGKNRNVTLVDVPNGYHIALTTTSTDMANVSISEGNSGETKVPLQKSDSTETVGQRVTTWTVKEITVDADEDFLVNIQYQNFTTNVEYHYTGGKADHTFQYEYTFTIKQPDESSSDGWKMVTDVSAKTTVGTVTKNADGSFTLKRSNIALSKEQDITYFNLTLSNIPPDAKLFVTHKSSATFSTQAKSAVLQLYVDSNITDVTKQVFGSNMPKTFSLPRLQPEFELDPSQKKHILTNSFSLGIGIARYNVKTTLLHGDPTLSVPVNLTGFMYTKNLPTSGNSKPLTRDRKIISESSDAEGSLSGVLVTVNSDALIKKYAIGSANVKTLQVEEIRRGSTGVSMKMDDSLSFSFTEDGNEDYAAYISPFIATTAANANGVKFNTIDSELTAQPGYRLKAIVFAKSKTKSVSNPKTSVAYEEFAQKNEIAGDIEIIYDIIPQEVHVSLYTGKNDGAKDYANRQKKFPVDITLLDGSDMPVDNQIYEYTDENGNEGYLLFNSEDGVQILENVQKNARGKITSYEETGKKPELKHGDEIVLKLPYQYTVVVKEEDPGNYTDTYHSWTDTAPEKVEQNRVKVDSVLESQNSYLRITNTRNDVEDEIGIFGGKANRAFLALVSGLSIAAAAAYLYARREEAKE